MNMESVPKWQFDESKHTGVDYSSSEEVAAYDSMHQRFRNYKKAAERILERLGVGPSSIVIDMGVGTGAFALHAASRCREIHAVDISEAMLDYTRQRANALGIKNIQFHHAGLLTYHHPAELADALVCVAVLHHLPDFWKQLALSRCAQMLKKGGKLYLFDIVFHSDLAQLSGNINGWIERISEKAGTRLGQEAVLHVRDEFSTYNWILEGMLRNSGFQIETAEYAPGFEATYICIKS